MTAASISSSEMLGRLVAFDTVSRNSNLAAIEFIRDYLDGHGIESRLTFDDDRRKANLFATIGPADRPGLIFSGHSDVVPVDGQDWTGDPFKLREADGKLFARGAADMKGFIATVLAMVPALKERVSASRNANGPPVHLAFSYDEEVGCIGVRRLIEQIGMAEAKPLACIVGEPTMMQPIIGQKGLHVFRCQVHGHGAHSSRTPYGVNAVEAAAELVAKIKQMARRIRDEGPFDHAYDPAYTTIHCGTIKGGTAQNIVPADCDFTFEIRNLPGHDPAALVAEIERHAHEHLEPEMHAVEPGTGFTLQPRDPLPDYEIAEDHPAVAMVKGALGANAVGKVAYMTEAGLFGRAGIPTVICGPGDIAQAHKPDEFIQTAQLQRCESFLLRLVESAHM
ncbi:MAG TPA: acetylornithine deacetylase [Alphaproteobacteria bacterium]|nr:acetylornithine deacetylase [Alphaproteobacteria bacterium]